MRDKPAEYSDRRILGILKSTFGFSTFMPNQEQIIGAVLAGRDVFAALPTGGGKSLCYQLPALLIPGLAVVISPLIALMKDQVDAARELGVEAEYLNSSLTRDEYREVLIKLKRGQVRLLYISPERFALDGFSQSLLALSISYVAIDEAHCISEWGHDFRPDYLNLSLITEKLPAVPVVAFTATATIRVQGDIVSRLKLRDPLFVRASFDRKNLYYRVERKSNVLDQVLKAVRQRQDESGIIYRTTRKAVEETAAFLAGQSIPALPYHAGLSDELRRDNQDKFKKDEVRVIVATIAFGMGIDKSNIRYIVHGDLPRSLDAYYQETGRAGRDGDPATCLLLFSRGDSGKISYFINQVEDEVERKRAYAKLSRMISYATVNVCRRKQILNYFGEEYPRENCAGCDLCTGEVRKTEATRSAQMILSAVARTGERFGAGHIVDIVQGADTKKIRGFRHHLLKTYGVGREQSKSYWRSLVDDLIHQGCLQRTEGKYPLLKMSERGTRILLGEEEFIVIEHVQNRKARSRPEYSPGHDSLFEKLKSIRLACARKRNIPAYMVFSDRTLREMCRVLPLDESSLLGITGVGERKLSQYGGSFLKAIAGHIEAVEPDA